MPSLPDLLDRFPRLTVLVIGDAILDEYITGRADRLSREAPVPVIEAQSQRAIPGGAANPAVNLAALGAKTALLSVVGADAPAARLREALQQRGVEVGALVADPERQTTVKTRILAQIGTSYPQHIARIDAVQRGALSAGSTNRLIDSLARRARYADALLVSDYRTGALTPDLIDGLRACASSPGALLAADAQGDFDNYMGFDLMKCNADEAAAYLGRPLRGHQSFAEAARALCQRLGLRRGMIITRGADGATWADALGNAGHAPAPRVADVFDTVGAGDTAIAVMTLALCAGGTLSEAAQLANLASGIAVRHLGNYAPTRDELRAAL
ncbi:MAG: bifunctional ADP-heptose synthase [Anaerolineae bacterium]|nr:bifunctional ADP-heptose synthase [Anaerolineae bacterium]